MPINSRSSTSLLLLTAALACSRNHGASTADSASGQSAPSASADTMAMVRGTVVSASPTSLVIKADTGNVTVAVAQPVQVYARQPGKLTDVKDNSFVGVTSVKQSDGTERATEIHIFPDALRGLGEGSRMMTPNSGDTTGSRMTNGAVSGSRMTNGTASPSRMSNGNVQNATGSSLVVQYAGGSQQITVPPNTSVTVIAQTSKALAPGEQVVVVAKRAADGSLSANAALLTGK